MSRILTSWKEIADYLGKGVRTVQRWEGMNLGLPVRRPANRKKGMVIAMVDEIDAWVQSHTLASSSPEPSPLESQSLQLESQRLQGMLTTAEAEILELRERLDQVQNLYYAALTQLDQPRSRLQLPPASPSRHNGQSHGNGSSHLSNYAHPVAEAFAEDLNELVRQSRLQLLNSLISLCFTYLELSETQITFGNWEQATRLFDRVQRTVASPACHADVSHTSGNNHGRELYWRLVELTQRTESMRPRFNGLQIRAAGGS